ncbi:type I polyketide synthase [Psychromicrobium lacuslunae]|uniref:Uncharacterized protein n=1 Tax=Psychromicrobium lacuslunae TaxID=1618207 RepID=A0A0D4C1V9_9MICC|nr:type I polyketide synthase [Psychromicrobium lacuslunae]AJT42519.1 hypothetical protein UM93_15320 [Psychromicrobium lacuslunae]
MRDRSLDIAVTGMWSRLPGPEDLAEWWSAVCDGEVLTSRFSDADLAAMGIPREVRSDSSYVPVRGSIRDIDRFDAELFGIPPRSAQLIDPQHRLMLEGSWLALEDAGRNPLEDHLRTAIFASSSSSRYAARILSRPDLDQEVIEQVEVGTGRDFMASRIAYHLGLNGPAMGVLTACSSSLVAVHLAMQALVDGDCDQAVVVAASAGWPNAGYRYSRGGIMSPDGVCRPFDIEANGTVGGSGSLAIVLRRYADAENEVPMHGVILGSAINNDGSIKAGFNAPSPQGEARAMRAALAAADITASSIGYLEMHGTGTKVGDPIEWSSTSEVFREAGVSEGAIPIGALKANIGHLDAASGLAGLFKTLKVVASGEIPPLANFNRLNPLLEQIETPLRVPANAEPWLSPGLRRAGVSSFGIGGTNSHLIVEQPPIVEATDGKDVTEAIRILPLSAIEEGRLDQTRQELAGHLASSSVELAEVSHTLSVGRAELPERMAVVGRTIAEAVDALRSGKGVRGTVPTHGPAPIIFLFPGQGSQRPGMGIEFVEQLPGFSDQLASCLDHFEPELADKIRRALTDLGFDPEELNRTALAQPSLFALEWAAATALQELGLTPLCVAGHSLGEITASCLSGMLSLGHAAALVTRRAEAMEACPEGAMLSVSCSAEAVQEILKKATGLIELAASNGPVGQVLSGRLEDIDELEKQLAGKYRTRRLLTSHGFHSSLMAQAATQLRNYTKELSAEPTNVSMVTGQTAHLIEEGSVLSSLDFLADGIVETVNFGDCLQTLRDLYPEARAIEVGPGQALSVMAAAAGVKTLPLGGAAKSMLSGPADTLARLWVEGQPIDLSFGVVDRRRLHLPGSAMDRKQFVAPEASLGDVTSSTHQVANQPAEVSFTSAEAAVREAWRDLLGHDDLQTTDNFLERGGDSLLLIRLARHLESSLSLAIELADLLKAQSLGAQIKLVKTLRAEIEDE